MPNFLDLLTPENCQLLFIDQQPQMAFGVQSIDRQTLKNNVVGLAKAAKVFKVPTIVTTVSCCESPARGAKSTSTSTSSASMP